MTEVLRSSPSHHFPSSPSSSSLSNDVSQSHQSPLLINHNRTSSFPVAEEEEEEDSPARGEEEGEEGEEEDQLSLLDFFVTAFRKYLIACRSESEELCSMEIGWPTNVRHVAHVTFDRFNGFLGLPVEFEPEVPRRAPSASAHVFGVSTESMQCSYDNRGNSVPTILLMMQKRLYALGGLQAEGIFRINAENSQEEFVRDQLNSGVVPDGIDVHCLAGLIKAWFRELPTGVLDPLEPEQVMQCESEEECAKLVRLLPPTEAALLNWAINLMADVVQEEHQNKMNARNVAMVFAPNMTHMSDPLTALMYAVQVMNFLKLLIVRTLKEREDSLIESGPSPRLEPSDENGHRSTAHPCLQEMSQEKEEVEQEFIGEKPILESPPHHLEDSTAESGHEKSQSSLVKLVPEENGSPPDGCTSDVRTESAPSTNEPESASSGPKAAVKSKTRKSKNVQLGNSNSRRGGRKANGPVLVQVPEHAEKSKGISIVSRINSRTERIEAWR